MDPSILSECIAGHASVIMTLYCKKSGITHVSEQMDSATKRINDTEVDNLLRWAKDATLGQLEVNTAYVDIAVLQAIKKAHKDGGGALIRTSLGLCAKGGEGCDTGGISFDQDTGDVSYREVPGYPSQKKLRSMPMVLDRPSIPSFARTSLEFSSLALDGHRESLPRLVWSAN
ncbi:MAG: hypothetical protein IPL05_09660 [Betaproteobacteria bacterium]|nr:hypothetical protein [Betaproteobacteria bacterium]